VERGAWSVESEEWSRNWEWAVIGVRDGSVWCGAVLCCAVVRCCAVFVTTLRRPISHKFVRNISSYHIARRIISLVVSYRSSYHIARRTVSLVVSSLVISYRISISATHFIASHPYLPVQMSDSISVDGAIRCLLTPPSSALARRGV
jgi:hypothetical protein